MHEKGQAGRNAVAVDRIGRLLEVSLQVVCSRGIEAHLGIRQATIAAFAPRSGSRMTRRCVTARRRGQSSALRWISFRLRSMRASTSRGGAAWR